ARRLMARLRSEGWARDQTPESNARRAFSTAILTSSFLQEAILTITSPVAGLTESKVVPAIAGVDLPPMTAFPGRGRLLASSWYSSRVNSDDILRSLSAGLAFDGSDDGLERTYGA